MLPLLKQSRSLARRCWVAAVAILIAHAVVVPLVLLRWVAFALFWASCYYAAVAKGRSGAWTLSSCSEAL